MRNTTIKMVTHEDILELPEHIIGEIINGRIETQPRPSPNMHLPHLLWEGNFLGHSKRTMALVSGG